MARYHFQALGQQPEQTCPPGQPTDAHSAARCCLPWRPPQHSGLPTNALLLLSSLLGSLGSPPQLQELYLTDQAYDMYTAVERLMKKRRGLRVQAGETDSDSAAWGCVLAAQGRSYGDGLYGRW